MNVNGKCFMPKSSRSCKIQIGAEMHRFFIVEERMKERPILFSGDMVRAILEGRKTQTRRAVKPQPGDHMRIPMLTQNGWQFMTHPDQLRDTVSSWRCPFGIPGNCKITKIIAYNTLRAFLAKRPGRNISPVSPSNPVLY